MVSILGLVLLAAPAPKTITLSAQASVWVYSHASDPGGDEFLRVWGAGGMATPEGEGDGDDWSYGYLRFDVSKLPAAPPSKAVLVVYNVNPASLTAAGSAASPLQARALVGAFDPKTWEYQQSIPVHPDLKKTVFGDAFLTPWGANKEPLELRIDLLKGPGDFRADLAAAKGALSIALTSGIDPNSGDAQGGWFYKLYSAATKTKYKPKLELTFGPASGG